MPQSLVDIGTAALPPMDVAAAFGEIPGERLARSHRREVHGNRPVPVAGCIGRRVLIIGVVMIIADIDDYLRPVFRPGVVKDNIASARHKQFLKQVGDLGLKILVTEMDVHDQKLPADVQARDQAVAAVYYNYLSGMLAEKAVIAVLTWGLCNKYTWLNSRHPRPDGLPIRPLPFDENMNPTPVWDAIARALDDAPPR